MHVAPKFLSSVLILLCIPGLVFGGSCPNPSPGHSLRVLTLNTQLLPPEDWIQIPQFPGIATINIVPFDVEQKYKMSNAERADHIVNLILNGPDVDIVVLNEVWQKQIADRIITGDNTSSLNPNGLKLKYPNYVGWASPDYSFMGNEFGPSGIMIFTKEWLSPTEFTRPSLSSVAPDNHHFTDMKVYGWKQGYTFWPSPGASTDNQVPTVLFSTDSGLGALSGNAYCAGNDCLAGKGAVFLRLQNNCVSNRTMTMVATHLQSDDNPSVRCEQLHLILQQLAQIMTPAEIATQPVLLLGDLNINGTAAAATEWNDTFNNPINNTALGSFYALGASPKSSITVLEDSWARELPSGTSSNFPDPADVGQTSSSDTGIPNEYSGPGDGSRLDYVLNSKWFLVCIQYAQRAFDLVENGKFYSDHLGLRIAFNDRQSFNCNPKLATPISFPTAYGAANYTTKGTLHGPDGMQWYKVTEPGTYAVWVDHDSSAGKIKATIYQESMLDIGVLPISWDSYTPTKHSPVSKWTFTNPPYYIRVYYGGDTLGPDGNYVPNRSTSDNSFKLNVHRLGCTNGGNDVCDIRANQSLQYGWPYGQKLGLGDRLYWKFVTDQGSDLSYPSVEFQFDAIGQALGNSGKDFFRIRAWQSIGLDASQAPTKEISNDHVDPSAKFWETKEASPGSWYNHRLYYFNGATENTKLHGCYGLSTEPDCFNGKGNGRVHLVSVERDPSYTCLNGNANPCQPQDPTWKIAWKTNLTYSTPLTYFTLDEVQARQSYHDGEWIYARIDEDSGTGPQELLQDIANDSPEAFSCDNFQDPDYWLTFAVQYYMPGHFTGRYTSSLRMSLWSDEGNSHPSFWFDEQSIPTGGGIGNDRVSCASIGLGMHWWGPDGAPPDWDYWAFCHVRHEF